MLSTELKALWQEQGFSAPTLIQEQVYPLLQSDQDVIGLSPTGSGKTLAFLLPLLERIQPKMGLQVLIVVPSQELAAQMAEVARTWAKPLDIHVQALAGGANVKRQLEKLKAKPELVIGTAGRVLNLAEQKKLKLHQLETLIIDEADEMLTGETFEDIRKIAQRAPGEVQFGFFSATQTDILTQESIQHWFGVETQLVDVREKDQSQGEVLHSCLETPTRKRADQLRRLASTEECFALVFFNQLATLEKVAQTLKFEKVSFDVLTSEQRQTARQQALQKLRKREIKLLLTTDVAARGLDIVHLPFVINYDLPLDVQTYTHRSGRTGRMGESGVVITLANEREGRELKQLLKPANVNITPIYLYGGAFSTTKPEHQERPVVKKSRPKEKKNPQITETTGVKVRKKNRKRDQKNKGKRGIN